MKRVPALLLAVSMALLVLLGTAGPASAHASLVSSDPADGAILPAAPEEVTFTFDEPVRLVPGGLLVFDAAGTQLTVSATTRGVRLTAGLPQSLAEGSYVVTWRVVSADGHPIAGSLTFHVGSPSATLAEPDLGDAESGGVSRSQALVHGVNYIALLLAGGLLVFLGWTLRGVRLDPRRRTLLVRLLLGAAGVATASAALAVPLSGAYQRGAGLAGVLETASLDPGLVGDDLTVLVLQAAGMAAAAWAVLRGRGAFGGVGLTTGLLAALAVWSPALVGHPRAYEPAALLVLTDALHLSAAAVWLGGLVGLALCLPALAGRPREAAAVLTRFGSLAAVLLAVLALSGLLLGWRILGSLPLLLEQAYGRLLLVKVALVLLVVIAAAWNRYRLVPRVAGDVGHDHQRRAAGLVRRTVVAESALLLAVLGVTGFLTTEPPAGSVPATAGTADTGVASGATSDDLRVLAVLDAREGLQRRLIVQVQDATGEPVDAYDAPALTLRSGDVDLGRVPLTATGAGTYTADVVFPRGGTWTAQVAVRTDEFTSPVTTLEVVVD
ncbi:copper resistance protein CopC [Nocardioides sp. zg-ZUI104]|uniref:copper resistance CopC/CopD family protein n=1 Tax=Nocardioides faecalis TaxID=2803858 RepID=UPI001BCAD300|nr:copper resistance protein CopC [Nocardioides faecalis]MBS4751527.1 copper resistance protein CopC [Nocardioides faecalis]